jgi:hypothetical protein
MWRGAVVTLLAAVTTPGILLGCTGDDAAPVPPPTTAAPLTGLRVAGDLDHPAVAIKVSDERGALPQVGVDRADLVIVEPVSVSYTSLLAVFHSDLPERVGPVRSVLPVDAPLLGPIAPVFGNTMGATWAVSYVESVADVDDHGTLRITLTEAYDIDGTRTAPNDVFATPRDLLSLSSFTTPPIPYFSYAADGSSTSAARVGGPGSSLVVRYAATSAGSSGRARTAWLTAPGSGPPTSSSWGPTPHGAMPAACEAGPFRSRTSWESPGRSPSSRAGTRPRGPGRRTG